MITLSPDRITCGWKLSGTKTFRLASSKLLSYYGTNLQNPSPSLMRCIVPDENCVFIQRDQRGAEALIVAYEAPPGRFRELFTLNVKCHSYMALMIFLDRFRGQHPRERYTSCSIAELKAYPEFSSLFKLIKNSEKEYALGKMVIHAKNYDMGPRTFRINVLERSEGSIVLSHSESKAFLATHETTFPEILIMQAEIRDTLARERVLKNLFGFPREFTGLWSPSFLREAYAYRPQSTVGTITNLGFVSMRNYIKTHHLPWWILNNKHDSLLCQAPDTTEHREHCSAKLKEFLELPLKSTRGDEYKMETDVSFGYNWAKHHETTNPNGMKEAQ